MLNDLLSFGKLYIIKYNYKFKFTFSFSHKEYNFTFKILAMIVANNNY